MTRGYVFEISSNLDLYPLGEMNADTLANDDAGHTCSWFEALDPEFDDVDSLMCWFISALKYNAGIAVQEFKPTLESPLAYCFEITQENKECWFSGAFDALKSKVESTSLSQFASSGEVTSKLINLINVFYEDAVVLDSVFCSLADFIRSATPGTTYYVNTKNVVLMH